MQAVQETTVWEGKAQPNHIYLMDGDRVSAYIKQGTKEPFYFKKSMQISLRGRVFKPVSSGLFSISKSTDVVEVAGSKGQTYFVNTVDKSCSCPGYTFRGTCKHTKDL